jgi:hypothetical protein
MKPEASHFSFAKRAAEKADARERDEAKMASGEISRAVIARVNGGSLRGPTRYVGRSQRSRAFRAD